MLKYAMHAYICKDAKEEVVLIVLLTRLDNCMIKYQTLDRKIKFINFKIRQQESTINLIPIMGTDSNMAA